MEQTKLESALIAALIEERKLRYIKDGMHSEAAQIHAETSVWPAVYKMQASNVGNPPL